MSTNCHHSVIVGTREPAGYVDGLNLYAAYFDVNGVDVDGLMTTCEICEDWEGIPISTVCPSCGSKWKKGKLAEPMLAEFTDFWNPNMSGEQLDSFNTAKLGTKEVIKEGAFFITTGGVISAMRHLGKIRHLKKLSNYDKLMALRTLKFSSSNKLKFINRFLSSRVIVGTGIKTADSIHSDFRSNLTAEEKKSGYQIVKDGVNTFFINLAFAKGTKALNHFVPNMNTIATESIVGALANMISSAAKGDGLYKVIGAGFVGAGTSVLVLKSKSKTIHLYYPGTYTINDSFWKGFGKDISIGKAIGFLTSQGVSIHAASLEPN